MNISSRLFHRWLLITTGNVPSSPSPHARDASVSIAVIISKRSSTNDQTYIFYSLESSLEVFVDDCINDRVGNASWVSKPQDKVHDRCRDDTRFVTYRRQNIYNKERAPADYKCQKHNPQNLKKIRCEYKQIELNPISISIQVIFSRLQSTIFVRNSCSVLYPYQWCSLHHCPYDTIHLIIPHHIIMLLDTISHG